MEEKKMNAAEKIRERLGCYNIMMQKMPAPAKPKSVSYGENLRMHFARGRLVEMTRQNIWKSHGM